MLLGYTYDALGKRVMSVTGGHTYYFGYNQGSTGAWELQDTTGRVAVDDQDVVPVSERLMGGL